MQRGGIFYHQIPPSAVVSRYFFAGNYAAFLRQLLLTYSKMPANFDKNFSRSAIRKRAFIDLVEKFLSVNLAPPVAPADGGLFN